MICKHFSAKPHLGAVCVVDKFVPSTVEELKAS